MSESHGKACDRKRWLVWAAVAAGVLETIMLWRRGSRSAHKDIRIP